MRFRSSARRSLRGVPWGCPRSQDESSVEDDENVQGRGVGKGEELSQTLQVANPLVSQKTKRLGT